jgi:hypothetical protein
VVEPGASLLNSTLTSASFSQECVAENDVCSACRPNHAAVASSARSSWVVTRANASSASRSAWPRMRFVLAQACRRKHAVATWHARSFSAAPIASASGGNPYASTMATFVVAQGSLHNHAVVSPRARQPLGAMDRCIVSPGLQRSCVAASVPPT